MREIGGAVTAPSGYRAAAARCGIKTEGPDITLILSDRPASVAAVFTTNQVKAAPVLVSREHAAGGRARAIVANSGNANCCTGEQGLADARAMASLAAEAVGIDPGEVLVASTGVIGHPLPMVKVEQGIREAARQLSPEGGEQAALGVMTTDTRPKRRAVEVDIGGRPVRIGALAKGVGMIEPNMATMLCFITTDAPCAPAALKTALLRVCDRTFHCVTVDGDTSTNDSVFLLANGAAGGPPLEADPEHLEQFAIALEQVARYLVREIARDGEGATKLVEVEVTGAASEADARRVAKTIANSPLVKTALFGQDPNWGRVVAAAGRSGVAFDPDRVQAWIGSVEAVRHGAISPEYSEAAAHAQLAADEVHLRLDLGAGDCSITVYTCDFSYEYVKINAEYHT